MIPSEIRADFDFDFVVEDKASSVPTGYTPKFVVGGAVSLVKAGSVSGTNLAFSFIAADTTSFTTGDYWYQVIAENGSGGRTFIAEGNLFIQAKILGTGVYDGRTAAEQILSAIDATILGKATKDQQSYTIQSGTGSRTLSRIDIADLKDLRVYYAAIVAQQKRTENNLPVFKRHKFAFVND